MVLVGPVHDIKFRLAVEPWAVIDLEGDGDAATMDAALTTGYVASALLSTTN